MPLAFSPKNKKEAHREGRGRKKGNSLGGQKELDSDSDSVTDSAYAG